MVVFAFDRDWTVDVNPHPHREAVPLEWVRHLAHETDHPVYAIGNQTLADEAAIPGVVDIVGRHTDHWDEWLGRKQPDGRYERFPTRRERLALLTDLHPGENQFIVVDDIDLSDVNGWEHYFAWDFVEAVRNGDIDPDLPWCDIRADGGLPTTAGIMPPDVDTLRSFLQDHADADAFKLEYTKDGDSHSRVVADVSIIERTVKRPTAAIAIECLGLPPGTGEFTVRFDNLQSVHVVDPPDELFQIEGETPTEQAAGIAVVAEASPERVPIPTVVDILENGDSEAKGKVLNVMPDVITARPEDCLSMLPALRDLLGDSTHQTSSMSCIAAISTEQPDAVAPFAEELTPHISAEARSAAAAQCLADVAANDTADALHAVPALETLVAYRGPGFEHALFALNRIAADHPGEVRPTASTLTAALADDSLPTGPRLNAVAALGQVTSEYPDTGVDAIDAAIELLDADDQMLRANAAGLLGDVATVHANELVSHVDDLAPSLDAEDDYALINASAALARIAERHPPEVDQLADRYISLLDHDHRLVRLNACDALAHLTASQAADTLDRVRRRDEDEQVRQRAEWALSEINNRE